MVFERRSEIVVTSTLAPTYPHFIPLQRQNHVTVAHGGDVNIDHDQNFFYETELDNQYFKPPISCVEGYLTLQSIATLDAFSIFQSREFT